MQIEKREAVLAMLEGALAVGLLFWLGNSEEILVGIPEWMRGVIFFFGGLGLGLTVLRGISAGLELGSPSFTE